MSSTAHFFYNSRRNDGQQRSFFRTLRDPFMGSYDFRFAIKLYLRKEQTTKLSVKRGTSTSMSWLHWKLEMIQYIWKSKNLPAAIIWKMQGFLCSPTKFWLQHIKVPYSRVRVGVKVSKLVVPLVRINRLLTSLASAELLNVHLFGKERKEFRYYTVMKQKNTK